MLLLEEEVVAVAVDLEDGSVADDVMDGVPPLLFRCSFFFFCCCFKVVSSNIGGGRGDDVSPTTTERCVCLLCRF